MTGATAVHFGTNAGTSISGVTATSLTVTSPAGTGTVDVTVTTPNGTSAVNAPSDQFTYNPLPTVTGVSPNNGAPAGGNSVTVSGTNLTGATAVHFGTNPGTSIGGGHRHQPHGRRPGGDRHGGRHRHHPQWHLGRQRTE